MRKKVMIWLFIVIMICATAGILWGPIVSNVEQAKYTVVESYNDIEIRDYPPMIVAEVEVNGERKEAANKGFRLLAGYIFGNNQTKNKIAMTAPVIQNPNVKIAMTAPVTQEEKDNIWKIRFVMPDTYSMDTLPKPNNNAVKLISTKEKKYVVIRFSGFTTENNLKEKTLKLIEFMNAKKLQPISEPIYAFFNPPWTFPPLRRNEIMIEIKH